MAAWAWLMRFEQDVAAEKLMRESSTTPREVVVAKRNPRSFRFPIEYAIEQKKRRHQETRFMIGCLSLN